MKTIIFTLFLLLGIRTSYAQVNKESSILEDLVRRTHQTLRDVATRSGVPYSVSASWPEKAYVRQGDTLLAIPFDSLKNIRNHLEYDLEVVFDKKDVYPIQFLQGVIVLKPVEKERLQKLKAFIDEQKRIKK